MAIYNEFINKTTETHTLAEFIDIGNNNHEINYIDITFNENRDGLEFVVKVLLDDYVEDLLDMTVDVDVTSEEVQKYKYNPKMLSYDLYGSTAFFYVILRLNNLCNIHDFDISSKKLKLLPKTIMSKVVSLIYSDNKNAIDAFNNYHAEDSIPTKIVPYKH